MLLEGLKADFVANGASMLTADAYERPATAMDSGIRLGGPQQDAWSLLLLLL